jgi:hypothetical protein
MAYSLFTPNAIIRKERQQRIALFLVIIFTPVILYNLTIGVYAAETVTFDLADSSSGSHNQTFHGDNGIELALNASTTDDTLLDFMSGSLIYDPLSMSAFDAVGGVQINQGYTYGPRTSPGIQNIGSSIRDINLHGNGLYISGGVDVKGGGVYVIDTKGTFNDQSDDELAAYYGTSTTPSLTRSIAIKTKMEGELLYIHTGNGMHVIDTNGTLTQSDDIQVGYYTRGGLLNSSLPGNWVFDSVIINNALYVGTVMGLTPVDTKGTDTSSDDVRMTTYTTSTPIPMGNNSIRRVVADGDILYALTTSGMTAIDTNGTATTTDDVLVGSYNLGDITNGVYYDLLIEDSIHYLATSNGLIVRDTNGTATTTDDVEVGRYDITSFPEIKTNYVGYSIKEGDIIYISNGGDAILAIDTNGTLAIDDDEITKTYTTSSLPADAIFPGEYFVKENKLIISDLIGMVSVLPLNNRFSNEGVYISRPRLLSTTPTTALSLLAATSSDHGVSLSYRTGNSDAAYSNEFDDNTPSEHIGNYYDWETGSYGSVVENGGSLKFSDANPMVSSSGAALIYTWLDTGKATKYFKKGSIVTLRYRVTSDSLEGGYLYFFNEDYWDSTLGVIERNEWRTVSFVANSSDFSRLGIGLEYTNGTWSSNDLLEIDLLSITTADSMGQWGAWESCTNVTLCQLPLMLASWVQYKLDLSTANQNTTPLVSRVKFKGQYASSGIYTSEVTRFPKNRAIGIFNAEVDTPVGTAASFEYSTDEGLSWKPVVEGQDIGEVSETFMWRATLTSESILYTPVIRSVSFIHMPEAETTSTALAARMKRLEAADPDAAAKFKEEYPHLFDGTATKEEIQIEIIVRLVKVIELYLRLLGEGV